jgi:hypothetical protein
VNAEGGEDKAGILQGKRQHFPVGRLIRAYRNDSDYTGCFSPPDNGAEVFYFLKMAVAVD